MSLKMEFSDGQSAVTWDNIMERHIKVKVIYDAHESQKREAPCFRPCCAVRRGTHWRRAMGVSSARWWGGEREDLWANASIGGQAENTAKEVREFIGVFSCHQISQRRPLRGTCGRGQLYCTGAPGHWEGGPRACL